MKTLDYEKLKYFILDVDGTLTDSGIYYDDHGNELKRFSTRDGESIKLARSVGIKIIVITGRKSGATERRVNELKIDFCEQGILNKYDYLSEFLTCNNINKDMVGYIGDDINDLKAMSLVGFVGCPADSCREVKDIANYISTKKGGEGAVRDVIEHVLRLRNDWNEALKRVYGVVV